MTKLTTEWPNLVKERKILHVQKLFTYMRLFSIRIQIIIGFYKVTSEVWLWTDQQLREKCKFFTKKCPIFAKMDNFKFLKLLHQPIVIVYHTTKNCRNRSNQLWVMAFHTWICEKNRKSKIKMPSNFLKFKFWHSDKTCTCPRPYSIGFFK